MQNPSIDARHIEGVHPDCTNVEIKNTWGLAKECANGEETYTVFYRLPGEKEFTRKVKAKCPGTGDIYEVCGDKKCFSVFKKKIK